MASLSEIIELEPEEEPWCAGYAPSQGRRCHARTNARGRSTAMMLLNEGTKDLRAGRNIDTLLEDLAPYVLCTRFHQSQAWDLARRWKRQVRTYLDSQVVSTRYTRPVRTPSRVISQTAEANMEERIAVLQQRLREAKEEVRRLKVAQSGLPVTTNPSHREGRNMSAVGYSSTAGRASSGNPPFKLKPVVKQPMYLDQSKLKPLVKQPMYPDQSKLKPISQQSMYLGQFKLKPVVKQPMHLSQFKLKPVVKQPMYLDQSKLKPVVKQPMYLGQFKFKPVVEQHLFLFRAQDLSQDEDWDEEEESENSGGEDHADDDQDDDDDDDTDDEEHPEELVWCKARCGVNFHKKCIDQWLETNHASTCPTCRSNWKH
ncbi:Zinc finger, RING-type [Penicillium expansum]|uniref:Zinc finger, RING-type n=1 Tax=Penicillium expansum TaxID=27334 RepID=A0A0A2IND5_PENEN|nr:Zinc finger, RING-type [Penicillium expansum]KGO41730.1 Zinc finger, RING-type [Penicillium expansum]KGO52127.1 Zinc finger, RING-type [Penicillium expansum]